MQLELDDDGLLPVSIHDSDLEAVQELFGSFQYSTRRISLFKKLTEYIDALRDAKISGSLIIDGSFVMKRVDEPEDIDVVLVLPSDWIMIQELRPFEYNLLSKKAVKRTYPIEVFVTLDGTQDKENRVNFFHQVNVKWCEPLGYPVERRKGLVSITL